MMQHLMEASIEKNIAAEMQALYCTQLGKSPDQLTCQRFEGKVVILIEGGLTQPELLLLHQGQTALVQQVRDSLNHILNPKVKALIEQATETTVIDLLTAVHLETDRISFVAIFAPKSDSHE